MPYYSLDSSVIRALFNFDERIIDSTKTIHAYNKTDGTFKISRIAADQRNNWYDYSTISLTNDGGDIHQVPCRESKRESGFFFEKDNLTHLSCVPYLVDTYRKSRPKELVLFVFAEIGDTPPAFGYMHILHVNHQIRKYKAADNNNSSKVSDAKCQTKVYVEHVHLENSWKEVCKETITFNDEYYRKAEITNFADGAKYGNNAERTMYYGDSDLCILQNTDGAVAADTLLKNDARRVVLCSHSLLTHSHESNRDTQLPYLTHLAANAHSAIFVEDIKRYFNGELKSADHYQRWTRFSFKPSTFLGNLNICSDPSVLLRLMKDAFTNHNLIFFPRNISYYSLYAAVKEDKANDDDDERLAVPFAESVLGKILYYDKLEKLHPQTLVSAHSFVAYNNDHTKDGQHPFFTAVDIMKGFLLSMFLTRPVATVKHKNIDLFFTLCSKDSTFQYSDFGTYIGYLDEILQNEDESQKKQNGTDSTILNQIIVDDYIF